MKIKLEELEAALRYIRLNSFEVDISIEPDTLTHNGIYIKTFDKNFKELKIRLVNSDSTEFSLVTRTEMLPLK